MDLIVTANAGANKGWATLGLSSFDCALGRTGIVAHKREGDNATPAGRFLIREVLYRADRVPPPETMLKSTAIRPDDGWCDAPEDAVYNRKVRLPHGARHERLWREDHLYDIVVVIGYNDDPVVRGAGSAIFLHIARPDLSPTEGCVAFREPDLRAIVSKISHRDHIDIRIA